MAIEAHFRRPLGINDRISRAATLDVQTACAVAAFAADICSVYPMCFQPGVRRGRKVLVDVAVAFSASLRTNKLSPWNRGWNNHDSIDGHTGNQNTGSDQG